MKKRRVALVLAGGGARGVAHIGAIEELERQGFEISAVAGTSMGALVGGVYASGYLEPFKEWMRALDKYKVFSLVDFALSTEGLVKGDRVMEAMKELVPDVQIERMPVPFAAVAADLLTGDEVVLDSGGLYDAIRASISQADAEESMDAAACIGCGACAATCKNGSAMLFVAARVSSLAKLPQGRVEGARRAKAMVAKMDELGFGNCTNTGACQAECPKQISIAHIARLNREFLSAKLED